MLSRVEDSTTTMRPSPRKAHLKVCVHTKAVEDVRGQGRQPNAVRCKPAPGLPSQDFPLSPSDVHPVLPQTQGARVGANVEIGRVIAMKVGLDVTHDIAPSESAGRL